MQVHNTLERNKKRTKLQDRVLSRIWGGVRMSNGGKKETSRNGRGGLKFLQRIHLKLKTTSDLNWL